MASSSGVGGGGADGGVGDGSMTLDELYHINVVPAKLHFKFRKELQGLRVGLNFELFYNLEVNDFEAKVVLKLLDFDRKWKFQYKPISGDIQLLSKKIPVTKYLNLQVQGLGTRFVSDIRQVARLCTSGTCAHGGRPTGAADRGLRRCGGARRRNG
ncbi:hypothetical protein ZWY2020_021317 [Hordeum vulgare]|nr:hypothetical protein ZWY2020_021317 [Hordeum vulgare]